MSTPSRILFFGTDRVASHCLKALSATTTLASGLEVVCPPPRKQGRGHKWKECEVHRLSLDLGLKTHLVPPQAGFDLNQADWTVPSHNDAGDPFDLGVVVDFGYRIPTHVTDAYDCINVHPSLLPRHRGASPLQTSILSGDQETGVCIITVDPEIDSGRILHSVKHPLDSSTTFSSLRSSILPVASDALLHTLSHYPTCVQNSLPQDITKISFAPKIPKERGEIDWWQQSAEEVHRLFRGLDGFLPVFSSFNNTRVHVTLDPAQPPLSLSELYGINGTLLTPGGKALSVDEGSEREPGCFWYEKRGKRLYILCKDRRVVACSHLQFATKKVISAADFFNSRRKRLTLDSKFV